ncbi:MAG: MmgE/PrpD family protein [Synergistaceae bacterium]|jgi:2-methylcitrate dehydratase PrpD|nr:MmgE/PrpD family protein [Synergistaceae bacterium]
MRYNRLLKDNDFLVETEYTKTLSEFAASLRYEDIPTTVLERAKMILLQTIGVSLAAKDCDIARKIRKIALEANNGNGGPATAWITGEKISAASAALIAGTVSDLLDWEDCSWTGHPSAGIIPAAWITAEERGKSGKDLLTAIVTAYEVYQRIANAAQPGPRRNELGWGLTSWQIFGVSAAAAKIYGFDPRRVDQTIGMSVESSTIPACYHNTTMSDFYHYEHGYRARTGVLIVKAVEKGVHNQRDTLDAPNGYWDMITDEPKLEWLLKDLGKQWLIMETLLKHWPANMWVQAPAEALSEIVANNRIIPEEIEEIVVDPGIEDRMWIPEEGFRSVTQAEFSVPFVLSALVHDPVPGAAWYSKANLSNPSVIRLAQRVKEGASRQISPGGGFAKFRLGDYPAHTVTVKTTDGRVLTAKAGKHPGHPHNMLTTRQFVERFELQASPVLRGERLKSAVDILLNIEGQANIAELSRVVS